MSRGEPSLHDLPVTTLRCHVAPRSTMSSFGPWRTASAGYFLSATALQLEPRVSTINIYTSTIVLYLYSYTTIDIYGSTINYYRYL